MNICTFLLTSLSKMRASSSNHDMDIEENANNKQGVTRTKKLHRTSLYVKVEKWQWPLIYSPEYNIAFMGLEKVHPFDASKWGRVYDFLKEYGMIQDHTTVRPAEASLDDLMVVHSKRYVDSLKWSVNVAGITEVPPVALMPNFIVQKKVLRPFRFQTGGTILAGKLAMERGWAINIGGGFHHCCAEKGGGFCAYADITLAIRFLQQRHPGVINVMIIDLDAHQGNGHERDFMGDKSVYILDIYNRGIYPHDGFAKRGISRKIELSFHVEDEEYLSLVRNHVEGALNEFRPDIIVYNAGTDILDGDPLGLLSVSPKGIIDRDQIVFTKARSRGIPIMMVTSGGYQRTTARIIANSILNLHTLGLIACDDALNAPAPQPEPKPVESAMKRSISEGTSFFNRLRRGNCWSIPRSQTSVNLPTETGGNSSKSRLKEANSAKTTALYESSSSSSSSDEIFSAGKWCKRSGKEFHDEDLIASDGDNLDCEKLSLQEALSGLRDKIPPTLVEHSKSKERTPEKTVVQIEGASTLVVQIEGTSTRDHQLLTPADDTIFLPPVRESSGI